MGKGRARGQVSDGEHRLSCPPGGVDNYKTALVDTGTNFDKPDHVAVGTPADNHRHPVGRQDGTTVGPRDDKAGVFNADSGRVTADPHTQAPQPPCHGSCDAIIKSWEDRGLCLHDRYPTPQLCEGTTQLDTDVAAPNQHKFLRKGVRGQEAR